MTKLASVKAQELETILADLPADKVQVLLDFANYLRQRYVDSSQRGSATAILQTLEDVGPLQFEAGELDMLLDEIEAMRQLDMTDNG